jgi:hypothetical protein
MTPGKPGTAAEGDDMNAAIVETQTLRYRAKGFTDDVVDCEICGRVDLKGTVRLEIVDVDGNVEGEIFAGVVCAARHSGRKAAEIRTEAKDAEKATRDAFFAYRSARSDAEYHASGAALERLGLVRNVRNMDVVDADPGYLAEMAAWDATHPAPERPRGW